MTAAHKYSDETRLPTEPNDLPSRQPDSQPPRCAATPISTPAAGPNVDSSIASVKPRAQSRCAMLLFDPLLHTLASGLDDVESVRVAQGNRRGTLTRRGADVDGTERGFGLDVNHPAVIALDVQLETLQTLDDKMTKALAKQLHSHLLYPWIKAQCGLGDKQVARLLAAIRDPYWNDLHNRPRSVSELWAFCGLHVLGSDTSQSAPDLHGVPAGVAPRRRRGQKANWSTDAKTRTYLVAESCMKQRRSPYRAVYDDGRAKYAESLHAVACAPCSALPGTPLRDGHKHARAMRLVMKAILRDLWVESKRVYEAAS